MREEAATEIQQWSDNDWLELKRTQFETDVECYGSLVALMGDAGHRLKRPVWSDYEISAEAGEQ